MTSAHFLYLVLLMKRTGADTHFRLKIVNWRESGSVFTCIKESGLDYNEGRSVILSPHVAGPGNSTKISLMTAADVNLRHQNRVVKRRRKGHKIDGTNAYLSQQGNRREIKSSPCCSVSIKGKGSLGAKTINCGCLSTRHLPDIISLININHKSPEITLCPVLMWICGKLRLTRLKVDEDKVTIVREKYLNLYKDSCDNSSFT